MQAIIVAAGPGSRLRPLTNQTHKCLLEVGGKSILQRQLEALKFCGIDDLVVVTGHFAEQVEAQLPPEARAVYNPFYSQTNSMASLWFARWLMADEFVYLHSDVLFDAGILKDLISCEGKICFSVQQKRCDAEDMKVRVRDSVITEVNKAIPIDEAYGEFIGLAKVKGEGIPVLVQMMELVLREGDHMAYFERAVERVAEKGVPVTISPVGSRFWMEIDTARDLEIARRNRNLREGMP